MTVEMLENYFISINDKKFRAIQVYEALYKKRVKDIDDAPNIPTNIKNIHLFIFELDFNQCHSPFIFIILSNYIISISASIFFPNLL